MTHANSLLRKLLLLFISVGYIPAGNTDSFQPSFQTLLLDTSPGEIRSMLQDRQGYMWLGGRNSVLRYNAYTFQTISTMELKDGEARRGNPYYVTRLLQDGGGSIWLTSHTGLYRLDRDRDLLLRPGSQKDPPDPVFLTALQDIKELPSGELIFGGDGAGLTILDKNSAQIVWRSSQQENPDFSPTVQRIHVDSKKRIWVANNNGLNLFDYATKTFTLFVPNPANPQSKADNALIALAEDRAGNLLGGTLGKGLYVFNTETHSFTNYVNDPQNPDSIPDNSIWDILIDQRGQTWLTHQRIAFSWFDPTKGIFKAFNYPIGQPGSPTYNSSRAVFEDNNQNIWMGHYPGTVSFHDRSTAAISVYRKNIEDPRSISDSNILAVTEDAQYNLWIAAGDGVNHFNRENGQFKRYTFHLGNYPARGTLSAYLDKAQNIWVGTWTEGFYRLNRTTDVFEAQPFNASLANTSEKYSAQLNDATIWGFCETTDGGFWIGTHYAGINRYQINEQRFTKYRSENTPTTLANNIAWTCLEDTKGRFWIGTAHGLSVMDRDGETFKSYKPDEHGSTGLRSGSVLDIYEDQQQRIWLGTNAGLHLFREATEDFAVFSTADGFHNEGIRAITGDRGGNLWLGTNNGITRFNPDTLEVKNYLNHGGKNFGGVNTGSALTSHRGEIIFGTVDGLVIIDVDGLTINQMPPPVVMTDFKVFTKSVTVDDADGLLTKAINQTDAITLDYTKRMFSFEFAALNFRNSEKNTYAYKLEGFDSAWHEVRNTREAQYTNLNPGKYLFKVRAANNDGIWNDEVKTLLIHQLPPPWRTWWAYVIYAGSLLLILGYYVYAQKRKQQFIEKQNQLLELKVAERTRDLANKNRDIQSLLSNMRQGLFTVQEDGTIHHEYSAFLENIFETRAIANQNAIEFLFGNADVDQDTIHQVDACIQSSIGMEVSNYEFNCHLLPHEYTLKTDSTPKVLSLDWNPITENDSVMKLMVSVRDVTRLKILEQEALHKERELEMVAQLLRLSAEKYQRFRDTSLALLRESLQRIEQSTAVTKELLAELYRNMHTLKGNSRAHGLGHLANCAHDAETVYSTLDMATPDTQIALLAAAVENAQICLEEYHNVHVNVLGRHPQGKSDCGRSNLALVREIETHLAAIRDSNPDTYDHITSAIRKIQTDPLVEVLADLDDSLDSIAQELDKPRPQLSVDAQGIYVKKEFTDTLQNILVHIFRNSLDHGIESVAERLDHQKSPTGRILVTAQADHQRLTITVADDGRGLDLKAIHQKSRARNRFAGAASVTVLELANLIFEARFSTREAAGLLSGRGIGLDAVKHFVEQAGGEIAISLADPTRLFDSQAPRWHEQFALVITLPLIHFYINGGG